MLNTSPYIVSPTTTRAGFKNRLVTKDSYEIIPGDNSYVGKYDIPEVDLPKCHQSIDFACLLAIGTTPINIQSKQLDGLDKNDTLRSVRFTGTATYSILPGSISRSSVQLITNRAPSSIAPKKLSVFINGLNNASQPEGNSSVKILIDNLSSSTETETNGNRIGVKMNTTLLSTQLESSVSISVKMNNGVISSTLEN